MTNVHKLVGDFLRDLTRACANTRESFAKMYEQRNKCIAEKAQIEESLPRIDVIDSTAKRNHFSKLVSRFQCRKVPSFHRVNRACMHIGTVFSHVIDTDRYRASLDSRALCLIGTI